MSQRAWHQFTVRQLLIVTTVLAVLFAGLSLMQVPNWMRAVFGVYAMLFFGWEIIRWPAKRAKERAKENDYRRRRQQLILNRQALAEEVEQRRKQIATSTSAKLHGQGSDSETV